MVNVVQPLNIEFNEWCSQIRIDLPTLNIPLPPKIEEWREWASQIVNSNQLFNIPLPTNIGYPSNDDWRKWGCYFINNIYTQLNFN